MNFSKQISSQISRRLWVGGGKELFKLLGITFRLCVFTCERNSIWHFERQMNNLIWCFVDLCTIKSTEEKTEKKTHDEEGKTLAHFLKWSIWALRFVFRIKTLDMFVFGGLVNYPMYLKQKENTENCFYSIKRRLCRAHTLCV